MSIKLIRRGDAKYPVQSGGLQYSWPRITHPSRIVPRLARNAQKAAAP